MFFRKHSLTASAASLALMILMLLQCVSCAGGGGYPDLTSDPPGDTSVPDTAPPGLVIAGGADAYSIIRPSDAGEYAVKAAVTVNKALNSSTARSVRKRFLRMVTDPSLCITTNTASKPWILSGQHCAMLRCFPCAYISIMLWGKRLA